MIAAAANLLWFASRQRVATRFRRQLHAPVATQQTVLLDLLRRNARSAFGRQHGFAGISTPAEFAKQVPLAAPDALEPWVRRIRQGETAVLTTDPVTHLVPTSGSSGARKLIPFTVRLQREFDYAIGPWVDDLYRRHPSALLGPSYWSISPASRAAPTEDSVVPIGFEDDTAYLGGAARRLVAATMVAPAELRNVEDMEAFFVLTLVCLLRRRDLRLISVWHPSFLLLLLDALPCHWSSVLATISSGRLPAKLHVPHHVVRALDFTPQPTRAREIDRLGPARAGQFWPELAVISCWSDAHAALGAEELACRFPGATVQPKGLFATEACVTIPYAGRHPVAVGSHYFEFIDECGSLQAIDTLRLEQAYEVVVTTGGGLWRYRLGDRVRVDGFVGHTPSLRFLNRAGKVSDLRGEKISEEFAAAVIRDLASGARPTFAMLVAENDGPAGVYTLYWEGGALPEAADLDRRLAANPHYAWCRQLGQLRPARVFVIQGSALAAYYRHAATGRKLGDLKPPVLMHNPEWTKRLAGKFVR